VRIFKNSWFTRFARKEQINDDELRDMVNQLEANQTDAGLGGGVYKQRLARPGGGKSRGYRVIVFFRSGERTFFVYGFAKSDRENINRGELTAYKEMAKEHFALSDRQIESWIQDGTLYEI
jgi:hypothetical protein